MKIQPLSGRKRQRKSWNVRTVYMFVFVIVLNYVLGQDSFSVQHIPAFHWSWMFMFLMATPFIKFKLSRCPVHHFRGSLPASRVEDKFSSNSWKESQQAYFSKCQNTSTIRDFSDSSDNYKWPVRSNETISEPTAVIINASARVRSHISHIKSHINT